VINISIQKMEGYSPSKESIVEVLRAVFMIGSNATEEYIWQTANYLHRGEKIVLGAPDAKQAAIVVFNFDKVDCSCVTYGTLEEGQSISGHLKELQNTYGLAEKFNAKSESTVTTLKVQLGENATIPLVRECLKFTLSGKTEEERKSVLRNLFNGLPEYIIMNSDHKELPTVVNNFRLANLKVEVS